MNREKYTPEMMKRLSEGYTPWSSFIYDEMERDGVPPDEILKMIDQRSKNKVREDKNKRHAEWLMIILAVIYIVPMCVIAYKYRHLEETPWWFIVLLLPAGWMIPQIFIIEGAGNKIKRFTAWFKAWWRLKNENKTTPPA